MTDLAAIWQTSGSQCRLIGIQIPDHFYLRVWQRFALCEHSLVFFVLVYILCVFCIFPLGYVSFVVIISAVDCSCLKRYVSKMTYQCGKLTRAH